MFAANQSHERRAECHGAEFPSMCIGLRCYPSHLVGDWGDTRVKGLQAYPVQHRGRGMGIVGCIWLVFCMGSIRFSSTAQVGSLKAWPA